MEKRMSTTTLLLVSILTIPIALGQIIPHDDGDIEESIHQFLAAYQINFTRICPEKSAGFDESLSLYADCLDDTNTTFCEMSDSSLKICAAPFLKFIEDCVPEESKQVPRLLLNSHVAGSRFLCTDLPEMTNPCMNPERTSSFPCKQKTDAKLRSLKESPPNFDEVCEFIIELRECVPKLAEHFCSNARTKEAFEGLWEAFTTPCRSSSVESDA